MANYCDNTLQVCGPSSEVNRFKNALVNHGRSTQPNDNADEVYDLLEANEVLEEENWYAVYAFQTKWEPPLSF